jgi:hypothetical protein
MQYFRFLPDPAKLRRRAFQTGGLRGLLLNLGLLFSLHSRVPTNEGPPEL